MPKSIQPVKVGKKRYYSVFSTIVMEFITPFYPTVRILKQKHFEYRNLKVHNLFGKEGVKGTLNKDGSITISMKVYQFNI